MRSEGHTVMPLRAVTLEASPSPAPVDGWLALHGRFGRLPLATVLGPAIALASEGFVASLLLSLSSHLVYDLPGVSGLCPEGPLQPRSLVRLPGVARALTAIANQGREGHYGGEFGRALVELSEGVISAADLEVDLAYWSDPLRLRVWTTIFWTVPPRHRATSPWSARGSPSTSTLAPIRRIPSGPASWWKRRAWPDRTARPCSSSTPIGLALIAGKRLGDTAAGADPHRPSTSGGDPFARW